MAPEIRHQCLIYEGSPSLKLPALAGIIKRSLREGFRCMYLNSTAMVAGMGSTLSSIGVDVLAETKKGSLLLSSEPVSAGGIFNIDLMLQKLEGALDQALSEGYKGLWASGDMTWEFGPENDFSRLMEYELKLEELFKRRKELYGICQYHQDTLPQEVMRQGLLTHRGITVNQTLSMINPSFMKHSWPPDTHTSQALDKKLSKITGL